MRKIYIDGSYTHGDGGYGVVVIQKLNSGYKVLEIAGHIKCDNNNDAEIKAYEEAIKVALEEDIIYTDSRHVVRNIKDDRLKWIKGHKHERHIMADRLADKALKQKEMHHKREYETKAIHIKKDRVCYIDFSKYEYFEKLSEEAKEIFKIALCEYDINLYNVFKSKMKDKKINVEEAVSEYMELKQKKQKFLKGNEKLLTEIAKL